MSLSKVPARSLRALLTCSLMAGISGQAGADPPHFRVTDLGALGFNPSTNEDLRTLFGINNHGEVVFCRNTWHEEPPPGSYLRHAMLCLPASAAYGLQPGVHDLNDYFTMGFPNVARDDNIDGLAVGQIAGDGTSAGEAVVWDLAANPWTMTLLGHLPGADWSRAFAINDADPPVIVGESDILGWCPWLEDPQEKCGEPDTPDDRVLRSFKVTFEGSPPFTLTPLGVLDQDCDETSSARDVADLGSGQWQAVGISHTSVLTGLCIILVGDCTQDKRPYDAVAWNAQGLWELPSRDADRPSVALGVNEAGQSVGWGFDVGAEGCNPDALFWGSDSANDRVNLGAHMPAGQAGDNSFAQAINNLAHPQIVGWNDTVKKALLWETDGQTWTGTDLNDEISPLACVDGLREALDINDDGWIVCWGDGDLTSLGFDPHCYLLTPAPDCPEDLTGDGKMNIDDLFEVLGHWGDPPLGVIWKWDVNFDCTVDTDDIFAVLAAWGPCGGDGGGGGDGIPAILAEWLDAGGAAALDKGLITWDDIDGCLKNDSDSDVEACLYGLLKQ